MTSRGPVWRILLVLVAFFGVGWWTLSWTTHRAQARKAPPAQVQLAALMAGLFGGGAAAMVVGLATLWVGGKNDD
ncbi:MAG: hypothetical protein PW792_14275 [Acidobacteriaceae bacterium]|nr:hypothetical protein [Acidobacteriaceae bacterium]